MTTLVVHPAETGLVGSVPAPSDKSIGHRAIFLAALANGKSEIRGYSQLGDHESTAGILRAMGVAIEESTKGVLSITGRGLFGLRAPRAPLDCGNSGTTMRLALGILAGQDFASTLVGDSTLQRRPMARVISPLNQRGAKISGRSHKEKDGEVLAPLVVSPLPEDEHLGGLDYESAIASAQVKSAVLLSGLFAHGTTRVTEPYVSRDHTERMLLTLGVPIRTLGTCVELDPAGWSGQLPGFDLELPGDLSAAAFLLCAACLVPDSRITVRGVGTNPTRSGFLDVLRDMGAQCVREPLGERAGEPLANVEACYSECRKFRLGGETLVRAVDEVPALCVLAAFAEGESEIRDARELRTKESDRLESMARVLNAFDVACHQLPDGIVVQGRDRTLKSATVDSQGDHRIAMAACLLALRADKPSRVLNAECIQTSFPKFVGTLRALGARIDVEADIV